MPEYILPIDNAGPDWHALDAFTQGFVEAAFFSSAAGFDSSEFFEPEAQERVSEGRADGSIPSDAGPEDIDPESLARVTALCKVFQEAHAALLEQAYACDDYDAAQAGRDFYYTRAGHGVGYWDRKQLAATSADADEYERLTAIMISAGDNKAAWDAALAIRKVVEARGLGQQLTTAAGRCEVSLDAYQDDKAPNGFYVSFYC